DISKISGISYRKDDNAVFSNTYENLDISKLNFPVFDCVKDMDFTDFRYPLLTSRGCPYGCIFCCVGLISGKKWRAREPEDIVNELLQAKENYQIQSFEIMDDNFTFDIDRAKRICRLIIKKNLNLNWWCHNGLRADRLDQELLNLMKKAGCKSIALGIESGDKAVFDNINKGEELSDIVRAVKMIKRAGIKCVGYFIVGLPGDSTQSTKESVRLQRGLGLSDYKYNMLIPYPGTKVWDMVREKGRLLMDIKGIYHFGDNLKIPFETDKISKKTLEQCIYLTENQEWVHTENDLININKDFKVRFASDPRRIVFMENGSSPLAKNIGIECKAADVLKITPERIPNVINDKYLLKSDGVGSCFDMLFRLTQEEGYSIICDIPRKKLFARKVKVIENECVKNEVLPHPSKWDRSARKYLATRLKENTSDLCTVKNGVIYQDQVALPFSHSPQWEKTPCGKIESGLVFISTAAFNPKSIYTADYFAVRTECELLELVVPNSKDSILEKIISEADILFCPESLRYFSLVFSRAKINALYSHTGTNLSECKTSEYFSIGNFYLLRQAKKILNIKSKIKFVAREFFMVIRKISRVFLLWIQILVFRLTGNIKDLISKIAGF
ncbi:MAG: radical SAM protein, partial [Candidatus Omnitrophica bacterium]|nr:radical SAM protein [Candidatus Omnitrophota bacterium]